MYLLSIIIPIYNVEKYVKDCIESVLGQLPDNVQVICINDGTPDKSMDIVRSLLSEYSASVQKQFLLIDQKNKGLSGARNTGLNLVTGQYIGFLDSDDKLQPNYFSTLLEIANLNRYDIIDFNLVTSEGIVGKIRDKSFDSVFSISRWYCPTRLFKNELIGISRFTEGIHYEDVDFTPKLYIEASSTIHIKSALYWYRTNKESITQSFSNANNIKTVESLEVVFKKYIDLYNETKNGYYAVVAIHTYYVLCISACTRFNIKKSSLYIKKYHNKLDEINLQALPIDNDNFDHRIRVFLNRPLFYIVAYRLYYRMKNLKK